MSLLNDAYSLMEQADRLIDSGGDRVEILSLLDRVIANGTDNTDQSIEARWWRGQIYFTDADYGKAIVDFDVVVASWGERHADVFAKRAVAHAILQNNALAAADVATLQRIDPRSHWFLHYVDKLFDRADLEAMNLLIVLQPTVSFHYFRRATYRRLTGDIDGARSDMEHCERLGGCAAVVEFAKRLNKS